MPFVLLALVAGTATFLVGSAFAGLYNALMTTEPPSAACWHGFVHGLDF